MMLLCLLTVSLRAQNQSPPFQNFYDYQKNFYATHKEELSEKKNEEEVEDGELERFQRMEWFTAPRVYPTGDWKNFSKLALDAELTLKNSSRSSNGRWQACGPNNINAVIEVVNGIGRVTRIAFGPSGNIYAGTVNGGLWKRSGGNWTCITNFIPNLTVSGVAIDPLDENVIYISTGDADGTSGPVLDAMGVFKTNDGGLSWYKTGLQLTYPNNFRGYKIIEHPTSPNILMLASSDGILRTTDSGLTWDTVATDLGNSFFDIEFKPTNPNVVYACSRNHVFHSLDAGATWSAPSSSDAINGDGYVSRTSLAVTADAPNNVYVLCGRDGDGNTPGGFIRLLKSTNGSGAFSFSVVSSYLNTPNLFGGSHDGSDMRSQAGYDMFLAVNPSDANDIYLGGINIWHSSGGGAPGTWGLAGYWATDLSTTVDRIHADQHDAVFYNGDLYVGNDGGIYFRDIGAIDPNWDAIYGGLNISQFYSIELDPSNPNGHTLLGAQDNGEMVYDGDDNFQTILGGDGGEGLVDPTDNNRYYFYVNDNLYKDGCDLCTPGTDSPQPGCGCPDDVTPTPSWVGNRALEVDPTFHSRLYSGYTCLFRSDNEGGSWSWQSSIPCANETIVDLDFDATNRLWVTKGFHVYRQNAAFSSLFTDITSNLPVTTAVITGLTCSSSNSNIAFACFSGYADGTKVYETIDGGTTWFNISGYLPNVPVNCIVYQPNTDDGLYIGTDIGVFYYDNSIVLWTPFRNGMPSVSVADLEISTVDNMLYAATFGRGLWKSDLFNGCQNKLMTLSGTMTADSYTGPFTYTSGYNTYRAIDSIVSNMPLSGGLGQQVLMISEGYIRLTEGFQATNTDFTAKYDQYCFNGFYEYLKGEYAGELTAPQNQGVTVEDEIKVSVYPNPFTDELKLGVLVSDPDKPIQLLFTDLTGRAISVPYTQSTYDGNAIGFRFKTTQLADGAYIISVRSGNQTFTKKVIKLSIK